jgi:acyl-CoA reductase-like NAD-dependent aldehyde dehydrogenase
MIFTQRRKGGKGAFAPFACLRENPCMAIASINPSTGETLKTFEALSAQQIEEKLQLAADTFRTYRGTPFAERTRMMIRAADILETRKHEFATIMTTEMGKPLKAAVSEAEKCAWVCRYYAETAPQHLADEVVETNARKSYVHFQPLGPVLAVMPWNFPFWQVFRFAAPALMAGNVGLLKHASNVPQCALAIEEIFRDAGFPVSNFIDRLRRGRRNTERSARRGGNVDRQRACWSQRCLNRGQADQENSFGTRWQRSIHRHGFRKSRRGSNNRSKSTHH